MRFEAAWGLRGLWIAAVARMWSCQDLIQRVARHAADSVQVKQSPALYSYKSTPPFLANQHL